MDLAKAFSTVNHKILLEKLDCHGIRGKKLDLMDSYLSNRNQIVRLDNKRSTKIIEMGLSQGTILGPLLFILYINDLLLDMPSNTILSYADDTAVISGDDTWSLAQDKMNKFLDKIANWLAVNRLSLNTSKTVFMTLGNYCDSVPKRIKIEIHKQEIKRVSTYKYLGIVFDYNTKWDQHFQYIISKTKYLIYKDNVNLLQNIQSRILKIIQRNFFVSNIPLNIRQVFTLESLVYHYSDFKEIYEKSASVTRSKSIQLPKVQKVVSDKNSFRVAIKTFKCLRNELKKLYSKGANRKHILKNKLIYIYIINIKLIEFY